MKRKSSFAKCFVTIFLIIFPLQALADWPQEEKKIEFLFQRIEESNATFIRNGESHDAEAAVDHLRMKLQNGLSSWFTPPKEKWTAELFIEKLASKSSISGRPYMIVVPGEGPKKSGDWLRDQLKTYKVQEKISEESK